MNSDTETKLTQSVGDPSASWRLRAYPLAVLLALAFATVLGAIMAADAAAPGEAIGGDFPAFYGAGQIAADGDWKTIYTLERQAEAQKGLHSDQEGQVARFFAYPPQVASLYQPLAALDYHWSYLVHTTLMALLLWGAVMAARPMLPWLRGRVILAMTAALLFWPMFRTVTGGSNTALTLFLIVAAWRLVYDDHQFVAGLAIAGLAYKPQFAIPLVGLFLLGRYWRLVAGALTGGVVFYLWGVLLQGWAWGPEWVEAASDFGVRDAEINGHSSISIIGFAENLFGVGMLPAVAIAWGLAGATVLFLSWQWWNGDRTELPNLMAMTMPGILLLSLHAMSHDGAVVVLTAAVAVGATERRDWTPWVAVIWALGASQMLIKTLGVSPGFPMLLIVLWWAWQISQREPAAVSR
ncbi:MAG: glycosyltransferase family 87 protein [Acidimicrobiia bacterium]|nr:glycosyltransferase family 87 protein [Acidimicrobiia bacterium]MDX2468935.1 glycosyltransferase family 87 protein [Acidimicrobiia bacterium]